jgi:hypothetical protein
VLHAARLTEVTSTSAKLAMRKSWGLRSTCREYTEQDEGLGVVTIWG